MSKKRSSTTVSNSSNAIDPWQKAQWQDLYGQAKTIAANPYQKYEGPLIAGFNQDQTNAFDTARAAATGDVGGGTLDQAISGAQAAAGYRPATVTGGNAIDRVGQYMNPFLQNVAGNVISDMDRARTIQMQGGADAARAASAFGGSRHGVAEAETNRNFYDRLGSTLTDLYSKGYDTAMSTAGSDINRDVNVQSTNVQNAYNAANLGLSAATQLAGLSDQERRNAFQDAAMLEQIGNTQQAQTQREYDMALARWQDEQGESLRDLGLQASILSGMPILSSTSSGTSTGTQAPSQADQAKGWINGIGSLIGFSDRNIKKNIRPADGEAALRGIEKMPVSTWQYDSAKGGPADGSRYTGPMAQDMSKNLGLGNGKMFPVTDAIGTQFAATKALAKKVKKLESKTKKGAK